MNKYVKIVLSVLLTISIVLGGVGCMNIKSLNVNGKELILNNLNQKYNTDKFKIITLYRETDGNYGSYYRAVCESTDFPNEKFTAYAYLNGSDYMLNEIDEVKEIESENSVVFTDDYANIIVAHQYQDVLQSLVGDSCTIKCNIALVNSQDEISIEEINQGYEFCISNPDKDMFIQIYILSEKDNPNLNVSINSVIDEAKNNTAYGQYIYTVPYNCSKTQVLNDYYSNYDEFDTFIRYYADYISEVEYVAIKNNGDIERKFIKE